MVEVSDDGGLHTSHKCARTRQRQVIHEAAYFRLPGTSYFRKLSNNE